MHAVPVALQKACERVELASQFLLSALESPYRLYNLKLKRTPVSLTILGLARCMNTVAGTAHSICYFDRGRAVW